jgi:hypothetical protein
VKLSQLPKVTLAVYPTIQEINHDKKFARGCWLDRRNPPSLWTLPSVSATARGKCLLAAAQGRRKLGQQPYDVAHGDIETAHPGCLGSQDTFYVGTIKGVGRIYQQTLVGTYSKWAAAKLYTTKKPITAADLLNDHVLPCFEDQGMGIIRILTDRGTKYWDKPEQHDYQLYLALNDIEHTKIRANSPHAEANLT